jgi:hypothetical protein
VDVVDAAARDLWGLAQRYPKRRPIFIASVLTEPKRVAATRSGQVRRPQSVAWGNQKRKVQPLLEADDGISDTVQIRGLLSHAIVQCSRLEPCQPARVTAARHAIPVVIGCRYLTPELAILSQGSGT